MLILPFTNLHLLKIGVVENLKHVGIKSSIIKLNCYQLSGTNHLSIVFLTQLIRCINIPNAKINTNIFATDILFA